MTNPPELIVDVTTVEDVALVVDIEQAGPNEYVVDLQDIGMQGPTGAQGQPGPAGPAGPTGPNMAWGSKPSSVDGTAGATMIDTTTATLLGPKASDESMFAALSAGAGTDNAGGFELGALFNVAAPGRITALKYWRCSNETQNGRTLKLFNAATTVQLAGVATGAEGGTGWITIPLTVPVVVTPGNYVVSMNSTGVSPRTAPMAANQTGNLRPFMAVYHTTVNAFPAYQNPGENYLVDVVFRRDQVTTVSVYDGEPITLSTTGGPAEAGIRFRALAAMKVTALRFYRSSNTGQTTRILNLWNASTNALLASATTVNESGSGWTAAALATPYSLVAGQDYFVTFGLPSGAQGYYTTGIPAPSAGPLAFRWGVYATTVGVCPSTASVNYWIADIVAEYEDPWPAVPDSLSGVGPPFEQAGKTGQFYVDTSAGVLYGPKRAAAVQRPPAQNLYAPVFPNNGTGGAANFESGMEFRIVDTAVVMTGLRFFSHLGDTVVNRKFNLWNGVGSLLKTQTFTVALNGGWQAFTFTTSIRLTPGTYVLSYNMPTGSTYSYWNGTFANVALAQPNLKTVTGRSSSGNDMDLFPPLTNAIGFMVDPVVVPESFWPSVMDPARPSQMDAYVIPGNYTWTKPAGAKLVRVVMQASGSGGGSGCRHPATSNRGGGGGGGPGARAETVFAAGDLPATVTLVVSPGGAGGAAVTTDNTDGKDGGSGVVSYFGAAGAYVWLPGSGGYGGGGKLNGVGVGGGGPLGTMAGGTGGLGSAGAGVNPAGFYNISAMAGAGGGGLSTANAAFNGAASFVGPLTGGYAVTAAGTGGVTGGNGGSSTYSPTTPEPWPAGGGGAGGGSGSAGVGGNGGNGNRGGGGGGGGASSNGFNSGAGGKGGDGFVQVITYF